MNESAPATVVELLDGSDTVRRRLQIGLVGMGVAVLFVARVVFEGGIRGWHGAVGGAAVGLGLVLMAFALAIKVRWVVEYRGHVIRFENDPIRGERLYIDDRPVAKGGLGRRFVLTGTIAGGEGDGDRIVATSEAGLTRFTCRIVAEPAAGPAPVAVKTTLPA